MGWGSGERPEQAPRFHPGEEERQQLSKVAQQLEQELQCAQESLASVGLQLEAARQGQQESMLEATSLRQELTQQQETYARGAGTAGPRMPPWSERGFS